MDSTSGGSPLRPDQPAYVAKEGDGPARASRGVVEPSSQREQLGKLGPGRGDGVDRGGHLRTSFGDLRVELG